MTDREMAFFLNGLYRAHPQEALLLAVHYGITEALLTATCEEATAFVHQCKADHELPRN